MCKSLSIPVSIYSIQTTLKKQQMYGYAKAQREAIHGSNTIVDFYPPQGVTVSSWTA